MSNSHKLHSTFGGLDGVADACVVPSTLTYRERVVLKSENPHEYGRLYNTQPSTQGTVWHRLTADAVARKSLPTSQYMYHPNNLGFRQGPSGYVRNHTEEKPAKPPRGGEMLDPPIETLHPITLKNYKKKFPMDFMAAMRPDTQTATQTMRQMGTYEGDKEFADKLGVFLPIGVRPGSFHPDVTVGKAKLAQTS